LRPSIVGDRTGPPEEETVGRFRNSLDLAKSSWAVLRSDRELVLLPLFSFLATLVVAATFVLPIIATSHGTGADGSSQSSFGPVQYILGFVGYVVLAYVTIFFNAALVHAADERMRGGDPTLGSALRGAASRAAQILPWAIVSATVSLILRAIQERGGIVARIAAGFAGMAWSLVTFLVLPILVIEGLGVGAAIKRSSELFRRAWGEQVIANAGIGLVGFVAAIAGLPVLLLAATGIFVLQVIGIGLFAVWVGLVVCVTSALSGVFQTALYHYAANGMPPAAFAPATLEHAFVAKRKRDR
jgi:Family of unknown function (DUF6159)